MVKKNGQHGPPTGFDASADFIPFEFTDDEYDGGGPGADTSTSRRPLPAADGTRAATAAASPSASVNGHAQKRKRNDIDTLSERLPSPQRRRLDEPEGGDGAKPWQTAGDAYALIETAKILHQEVLDFTAWISPTKEEESVRALVVKRIVDAVEAAFPQTRVSPFGSFKTKLYTPGAYPELISIEAHGRDIDLIVDWPGHSWTKSAMRRVAHGIERKGLGRNFTYIFSAKVPIVKFVDTHARIDIDLSFNQTNGLEVATLVRRYLREFPALRPLVMVLKTLFQQKKLSNPAEGGLGSYSIICMVVSFLQRHPKVAAGHILPDENLGAMLIEILELYGTRFNYDRVGIAVDRGGYYFDKLELQSRNQTLWRQISIRDPNDESNNIAKASHQVDNIIKVFTDAFREITTRCYVVHGNIRSGGNASGSLKSEILDAILYSQKSLGSRTELPISQSGQNPSTSNLSRRERRQKERSNKDAIKMNGEGASTTADMSNRRGVDRDRVPREASVGVGGSKDAPILLDDSAEQSPSFAISEIHRTPKKKSETGGKKSAAGKSGVVVKLQAKTSV